MEDERPPVAPSDEDEDADTRKGDGVTLADSPHARAAVAPGDADDEAQTRPASRPSAVSRPTTHSATAARALRTEELVRARSFARMISLLSGGALVLVWLVWREETATPRFIQLAAGVSLLVNALTGGLVWLRVQRSGQPRLLVRVFGFVAASTALVVQVYAGVFSPAPTLIALGICYFGMLDDRPTAIAVCFGATSGYTLLAAGALAGWVPDVGLFAAHAAPLPIKVAALATVLAVFLFLFFQARDSRRATHQAIERLDEALQLAQQREALLEEANHNLDMALAAGGRRGAFSGRTVGRFRLAELIGRGGMGEVYAAMELSPGGGAAAVKVLAGHLSSQREVVQRFLREAEVARRLQAPNLVEILELGEGADGTPFIAMERLHGRDLGWHLRRRRQLPIAEAVELAAQVAAGLGVAHAAGVVHRDLKPANLFCVESPGDPAARWKILDFGVAKLRGSQGTLTRNALVGTPGYMSPEQAQGDDVDARSDVFSLGAVLYRALTGRPAFHGADAPKVLFDVVYRCPTQPSEIAAHLPADVDLVLAVALAKERSARFPSGAALATALQQAVEGELPEVLRNHARELLRVLPWGTTIKP
jgi:serine/threonine-protein kinase